MKISLTLSTFLLGALAPTLVKGGYPNPHVCETDDAPGIKCHTSVAIDCTINATGEPCLNPDQDNEVPFMTGLDLENCQTIPVTIKFKMCNLSDKYLDLHENISYINYIGQSLPIDSLGSSIMPGACKEVTKQDNWNTCRKMRPMSVQLDGRIIGDPNDWTNDAKNVHCYCYLYKRATFSYIQDEPIGEDVCTDSNFIITECARPGDARWSGSYIELFNPLCAGKKIGTDIQIVRIDEYGNESHKTALKDIQVDTNGFIVLCNNKDNGNFIYGAGVCDGVSIGSGGPTYSGKDTFALTLGGDTSKVIDIYGNKGLNRDTQNIFDGRCVRKTSIRTPRPIWNVDDWIIFKGTSDTSQMDPHVWTAVDPITYDCQLILTEISDPQNEPQARFVEIYSSDCAGKIIPYGYRLVHFVGSSMQISGAISLSGQLIPADGVFVTCASNTATNVYGPGTCQLIPSFGNNAANNSGRDNVAIIKCANTNCSSYVIVDMFGVIGEDGSGSNHDFSDGHAVRIYSDSSIVPKPEWNPGDWNIFRPIIPSDNTPGTWPEPDDGGIEPPPTEVVICDSRASKFKFRFYPRLCEDSDNFVHRISGTRNLRAQHKRHLKKSGDVNDKFWCLESSSTSPPSAGPFRVVIKAKGATETTGDVYLDETNVEDYDELTIVGLNGGTITTELNIYIYNSQSSKVQEIMFHSSCSMELSTSDTFGSIELIGFENDKESVGFS
jgi:hypothetical protein